MTTKLKIKLIALTATVVLGALPVAGATAGSTIQHSARRAAVTGPTQALIEHWN